MRDQLEALVQEMLDRGVRYEDARQEFEKVFITRALQRSKGSVGDAADCSASTATPSPGKWRSIGLAEKLGLGWLTRPADRAQSRAPNPEN